MLVFFFFCVKTNLNLTYSIMKRQRVRENYFFTCCLFTVVVLLLLLLLLFCCMTFVVGFCGIANEVGTC